MALEQDLEDPVPPPEEPDRTAPRIRRPSVKTLEPPICSSAGRRRRLRPLLGPEPEGAADPPVSKRARNEWTTDGSSSVKGSDRNLGQAVSGGEHTSQDGGRVIDRSAEAAPIRLKSEGSSVVQCDTQPWLYTLPSPSPVVAGSMTTLATTLPSDVAAEVIDDIQAVWVACCPASMPFSLCIEFSELLTKPAAEGVSRLFKTLEAISLERACSSFLPALEALPVLAVPLSEEIERRVTKALAYRNRDGAADREGCHARWFLEEACIAAMARLLAGIAETLDITMETSYLLKTPLQSEPLLEFLQRVAHPFIRLIDEMLTFPEKLTLKHKHSIFLSLASIFDAAIANVHRDRYRSQTTAEFEALCHRPWHFLAVIRASVMSGLTAGVDPRLMIQIAGALSKVPPWEPTGDLKVLALRRGHLDWTKELRWTPSVSKCSGHGD